MLVLYQPVGGSDWSSVDAADWASLAAAPMNALACQGLVFEGADHYSVEVESPRSIRLIGWHDDPGDWPPGQRWARVVTIGQLAPDLDPRLGGAINVNQRTVIYAEGGIRPLFEAQHLGNPKVTLDDWANFDPRRVAPQHGQWLSDADYAAHQRTRSVRSWREWTDGLDPSEVGPDGMLKQQRPLGRFVIPSGTRTYFHNPATLTDTIHSALEQNALGLTATGATTETVDINQNGQFAFTAVSPSNEPNSAAWPTTGVYRYQIDVTAVGADLEFGLYNNGAGEVGGFHRINAGVTADLQGFLQDQVGFTGPGLHLASVTDPAWSAGSASDRVEMVLTAVRRVGHGNQALSLQLGETDDFLDGPWAAALEVPDNAPFFGANF